MNKIYLPQCIPLPKLSRATFSMLITFFLLLCTAKKSIAQTTLAAGDVAVVGINSANPDKFSVLLLKNITTGTVINFTDNGFTGTNTTGRTGEGFLTYTAPSGQAAGTVLTWTNGMSITGTGWSSAAPTNFALNASGDQMFVFQGSTANWATQSDVTLLFGMNFGIALSGTTNAANTLQPSTAILPASAWLNLPTAANANGYFANGSSATSSVTFSGTASAVLALIVDATKWVGTSGTAATFPAYSFTIGAVIPTVSLSVDVNNGTEASATVITVTATASSAVSSNQTVSLGVTGTGITAADYTLSNSTITIASGATIGSVTFTIVDDADIEGTETATLAISNPSPDISLGATTTQNITITDNDFAPNPVVNLSVSLPTGTEAAQSVITVTATASAPVSGDQTVSLGVSGAGITTGDYTLSNTVITIPDGSTTGSVTFTVTDDAEVEAPETATLTISSPSSGITIGSSTNQDISIVDNDVCLVPGQPDNFTAKTTFVYQGQNAVVYTVPNVPGVTYTWLFTGTGAAINGTSNSITIDYSATATSGTLSVTADNACGSSTARILSIALNTPIALPATNLDYSFVTVGCNRVDYLDTAFSSGDLDYSTGASTANVYQLKRLFTEISHLNPLPKFLVMTGDIVMGYKTPSTPDTAELAKQLTAWKAIYESHPLSSLAITLITVPGNHETQDKAAGKKSFLAAEQIFTRIMSPYIVASNGPGIGGADGLTTDQSKLTYSFDYKGDHYIMINTDPVGKDNQAPYKWIASDIQAARANNARHIFAFGHKPAYSSPFTPAGGLDAATTLPQRDSLWKYLEDNNCEAMFAAHEHLWDTIHPHGGKTWQVINGNGGSRVEPVWVGAGKQYYGYTIVNIYNDKTVNVMGIGRNTIQSPTAGGTPYAVNEDANPSTVRNSFNICVTTTSTTSVSTCGSYSWNGTTYNASGTYTYTTTNAAGCDSIATLILTLGNSGDNINPTITAPLAVTACTNTGCTATGVNLGTPTVADNCTVASVTNNAPAAFPAGITTVTWTVTDGNGNTATATQTVTVTDGTAPSIYITQSSLLPGVTGASSSASPYLLPVKPGVKFTSILSAADNIGGYKMSGIPDGLGAFDNCDGTFTLLMNHELGNTLGVARAHGGIGAFVSSWIINKSNLSVVSGSDLMRNVYGWNTAAQKNDTVTSTFSFNRFCSADLPAVSAYYNASTGFGSQARIFMHGEEGGATGYQLASVASGANKGKTYVLGKFNLTTNGSGLTGVGAWENALANSFGQDKTIVIGNNDGGTGIMNNSVSVYVGTKTNSGTEADKAGLTNGTLKFINVTGNAVEIADAATRATNITSGTAFTLSGTASTTFSRPEDGVWNPLIPAQYFFVTTDRLDQVADGIGTQVGRSRLWRLNFADITNPDLGGTIDLLLDGTEGQNMFDNITADKSGHLILLEDVGNAAHNGKIWQYTIATDSLKMIGKHDPARFGDIGLAATAPFNQDEETSGVIDVSDILGAGMHLLVDQAHYTTGIAADIVEGGQLLAMFNPESTGATSTARDTIRVTIPFGSTSATGVNLGTPAAADNCSIASVTSNAPSAFPVGTTQVTWTATDAAGNSSTAKQVVIVTVTGNNAPLISITSPSNPATFNAGITITVNISATDNDGSVRKVELFVNGTLFATDSIAPYTFSGGGVEAGVYKVVAKATDNFGATSQTDTLLITVVNCSGTGSITAQGYANIPGTQVSSMISSPSYPFNPSVTSTLPTFEYANQGDNYGGRLRGYICVTVTGNYRFWIAADEQAYLYLSTDESPLNIRQIAYTLTPTGFRQWSKYPSQISSLIPLVKGMKYYIETVHKEGVGADHLSVSWQIPGGAFEGPIPGNRLLPYVVNQQGARPAPDFTTAMRSLAQQPVATAKELSVRVQPNPSRNEFTLSISSNSEEKLSIKVMDAQGRTVEQLSGVNANGTVLVGRKLLPGIYFAEVIQGKQKKILKLIRQ
jgi:hypothetical protein